MCLVMFFKVSSALLFALGFESLPSYVFLKPLDSTSRAAESSWSSPWFCLVLDLTMIKAFGETILKGFDHQSLMHAFASSHSTIWWEKNSRPDDDDKVLANTASWKPHFFLLDTEIGEKVILFCKTLRTRKFSGPVLTESVRTQDSENIVSLGDPATVSKF